MTSLPFELVFLWHRKSSALFIPNLNLSKLILRNFPTGDLSIVAGGVIVLIVALSD